MKECYPPKEYVHISGRGFPISLKAILNLTVNQLIQSLKISIDQPSQKLLTYDYQMGIRWGFIAITV